MDCTPQEIQKIENENIWIVSSDEEDMEYDTDIVEPIVTRTEGIENEDIWTISSDEEDMEYDTDIVEPIVTRTEGIDRTIDFINNIIKNPKPLNVHFWITLNDAEYYKINQCYFLQIIGSINTTPLNHEILISIHGVRIVLQNIEAIPVTIDIEIDNIIQIWGYFGESEHTIFIYTNCLAADGIQCLLNNCTFDQLNKDIILNTIVCHFYATISEVEHLKKLLLNLPEKKFRYLTNSQANKMIKKLQKKDKNMKHEVKEIPNMTDMNENFMMCGNKLDDRIITPVKICDYNTLNSTEHVNDIVMEFYLNYCYSRKLSKEDKNRTYLFNSFFYKSLSKKIDPKTKNVSKCRHDRVKRWTKNVNIFEKDFIFIPINENEHWIMAVICYPNLAGPVSQNEKNSLISYNNTFDQEQSIPVRNGLKNLDFFRPKENLEYFCLNYKEKNGVNYTIDVHNWKKQNPISIKQPCLLIFDSYYNGGIAYANIANFIRDWIFEEYPIKYNNVVRDFSLNTMKALLVKVPQQPNTFDCGLFTMHYFEMFFKRPIVDYSCPITHLENWFSIFDVAYCQKRNEVQRTILNVMLEQGHTLPPGFILPDFNFPLNVPISTTQIEDQVEESNLLEQSEYSNEMEQSNSWSEDQNGHEDVHLPLENANGNTNEIQYNDDTYYEEDKFIQTIEYTNLNIEDLKYRDDIIDIDDD